MSVTRQHTTPLLLTGSVGDRKVERLQRIQLERGAGDLESYDELWLQKLVQSHPGLLPVGEVEPAFMPLSPVCMELPTTRGSIDNFFITPTGNLIFAECKLWRNPEARRLVVAQVLDYAESLTAWTYAELEDAVRRGVTENGTRQDRLLYDCVVGEPELDEADFIDAVSRNLRLGRGLFFIVGDGIREEAESLVDHLQAHAGIHFALALTELALYRLPGDDGCFVQPRLIARTVNIERGIVRLDDARLTMTAAERPKSSGSPARRQSLSAAEFLEHMAALDPELPERLQAFLDRLEPLGVTPEFRRTLILRWQAVDGTRLNIGYIETGGHTRTEAVNWYAREHGILDLTQAYVRELASVIGGDVRHPASNEDHIYAVTSDGKIPAIGELLRRQDDWIAAIERMTSEINRRIDQAGV